jgi:hypothetical protein
LAQIGPGFLFFVISNTVRFWLKQCALCTCPFQAFGRYELGANQFNIVTKLSHPRLVKRKERIPIQVTAVEKEIIRSSAKAQGSNASQMLRFLGLHADKFSAARQSLRELTSWLNHLQLITSSPEDTNPADIQAAISNAIAPVRSIEEALTLPRQIETSTPATNPDL